MSEATETNNSHDFEPDGDADDKTPSDKVAAFFDPLHRDGRDHLRQEVLFLNR
jgi:hypothetical protein